MLRLRLPFLIGLLALPGVGSAQGQVEINQTRALAGGVTSADNPGFPVTLADPGSYVLSGDLVVSAVATTAVEITADDVSLDLGGFSIRGPHVCAPGGCVTDVGHGVHEDQMRERASVRNGVITGFGDTCIRLGQQAHVEDVAVTMCGGAGIRVEDHGLVLENRVFNIGEIGIMLAASSGFARNVVGLTGLAGVLDDTFSGGREIGGNVCDDFHCSPNPARRRFYLTTSGFDGRLAAGACVEGFHMASIWELLDFSGLGYETSLGETQTDSGTGPPKGFDAWVRTSGGNNIGSTVGTANCSAYTAAPPNSQGTWVRLQSNWGASPQDPEPTVWWVAGTDSCNGTQHPVWCIEDVR
jgi:hypothetical protein